VRFILTKAIFEKVQKPSHDGKKTLQKSIKCPQCRHVFARSDDMVKGFLNRFCDAIQGVMNSFQMISLRQFRTV
jgi:hypothetical protein